MPLPASLGLCPDLWYTIFAKSRALAKWQARVTMMDELLSHSLACWIPTYYATSDPNDFPIVAQRHIPFACRFKLMEMTKCRDEEETTVSIYVFDFTSTSYVYTDEDTNLLFEDGDEEDVVEG
jgi:hypothetical protein